MRRFGHGHSLALGALLALALERHALLFFCLAFLGGVVVGRGWATLARFAYFARRRVLARASNPKRALRQPFIATRQDSTIPF